MHKGSKVIQIIFEKNEQILQLLRQKVPMRWSKTMNCWYVPASATVKQELFYTLKPNAYLDDKELSDQTSIQVSHTEPQLSAHKNKLSELPAASAEIAHQLKEFRYWMRSKRYSENTIGTYGDALKIFLLYYSDKEMSEITNEDVVNFNNDYILANKFSSSYQNQVVNAIKLFFRTIKNKKLDMELIHRPKRQKLLPNVLSKEEVRAILGAHNNIKHKTMLSLIYSCGLRCGELLRLKPEHIDSKRRLLLIKQSKGRKDRIVPLSNKVLEMLRTYYMACKPEVYLFEGMTKGEIYDERSLQNVLKQALEKAGINKPVSLHWLRHSYATHLLENGTDLRYIQEILGHSSSKTTEIYTHVSTKSIQNITSPFDYL